MSESYSSFSWDGLIHSDHFFNTQLMGVKAFLFFLSFPLTLRVMTLALARCIFSPTALSAYKNTLLASLTPPVYLPLSLSHLSFSLSLSGSFSQFFLPPPVETL